MEDALRRLGEDDIVPNSYIRLNVALAKDEQIPTDVLEKARRLAEERGFRFCLINPIRDAGSEDEKESHNRDLTMDQIREMSDEDMLTVLDDHQKLTDHQKDLLRGLLAKLTEAARG